LIKIYTDIIKMLSWFFVCLVNVVFNCHPLLVDFYHYSYMKQILYKDFYINNQEIAQSRTAI
jgi:hypothetical protein